MVNYYSGILNVIRLGIDRVGYLILGKVLSLILIGLLVYILPSFFDDYARTSIAGALLASVLIFGFPYIMQLLSQDYKRMDLTLLSITCLFFAVSTFIVLYLLDYNLESLSAVIVVGISPIIMGHVTEVFSQRLSNLFHFILIVVSQPLIFLLVVIFPEVALQSLDLLFCICIFFWFIFLFYLMKRFQLYIDIFILQSGTVLVGSGIVSYVLANSVLNDKNLEAGFLWLLIQVASVLVFLANSLSFRMIKYFSDASLKADIFRVGGAVYKGLASAYLVLFLVVVITPDHAPYVYGAYLTSQGISKVAGSAVLSLRQPKIPLYSALGSAIILCFFLLTVNQERIFSDGVLAVLVASFGGAAAMFLMLRRKSQFSR